MTRLIDILSEVIDTSKGTIILAQKIDGVFTTDSKALQVHDGPVDLEGTDQPPMEELAAVDEAEELIGTFLPIDIDDRDYFGGEEAYVEDAQEAISYINDINEDDRGYADGIQ